MFQSIFEKYVWEEIEELVSAVTVNQVEEILQRVKQSVDITGYFEGYSQNITPLDFLSLISPVAKPYLEEMAALSQAITRKRFGNTVQLYAPIYLSNTCANICTYCGFSYTNKIDRIVLNATEIEKEIAVLKKIGYDHILIVTGEDNQGVGVDYFKKVLPLFKRQFSNIALEVQPLEEEEYRELIDAGVDSVLVYQETYHKENYKLYHPKGKKSHFDYRLATPDRLGRAGAHKMGLGVLLGLENWRVDSFFCALHLDYLKKTYWQTRCSVSFPRLRPASGVDLDALNELPYKNKYLDDAELAQLIFAYRLFDEDLEISLSTREEATFRNNIISLGITTMSAGSKTNPGGYACYPQSSLEQFEINDERTLEEIHSLVTSSGMEAVIKDWSREFHSEG